jgi:hypothetical protein
MGTPLKIIQQSKGAGGPRKFFFGSKFPARLQVKIATSGLFGENNSVPLGKNPKFSIT